MATLQQFDTPAHLRDLDLRAREAWSADPMASNVAEWASRRPQFFDPLTDEMSSEVSAVNIVWSAFPARLIETVGMSPRRWVIADSSREQQDEYCEWVVERNADGEITSIVFTTELPEYWHHIAEHDQNLLLALYRDLASRNVQRGQIMRGDNYARVNQWNAPTSATIIHLTQTTNTMLAALDIVANSTVLRQRSDGTPVTDRRELVRCGGLGDHRRNSDPQIAEIVNDAAALGAEISLANPVGLYLDGLQSGGIITPDNADAADFWVVERGSKDFAVRARFEVPEGRGYGIKDIAIHGRPIEFGAQVADKVRVRISGLVKAAQHQEPRQPCL